MSATILFFTPFEILDGFDYSRSFEDKIDYLERSNFINVDDAQ